MSCADILDAAGFTAGASGTAGGAGGGAAGGRAGGAAQPAITRIDSAETMTETRKPLRARRARKNLTSVPRRFIRSAPPAVDSAGSSDRGDHASGDLPRLELVERAADLRQRPLFYRDRLDLAGARQRDHLFQFGDAADAGALDPPRALHHQHQRYRDFPTVKSDHDQLSALAQRSQRQARSVRRTDQIHRAVQRAAGDLLQFPGSLRVTAVQRRRGTFLLRHRQLRVVDVHRNDLLVSEGLEHLDRHQSQAARTQQHYPLVAGNRLELRYCGIRREPGARQRRRPHGIYAARVHQVLRMRNQQMVGIAAGALDADPAWRHAVIVHALQAARALAAADPRAHQAVLADLRILRVRPGRYPGAVGLMAQRHRRMHPAIAHVETLSAAEVEIALADVHVAVAHAAILQLQQHLGPGRLGRRLFRFLQRLAPFDYVVTEHVSSVLNVQICRPEPAGRSAPCKRLGAALHDYTLASSILQPPGFII